MSTEEQAKENHDVAMAMLNYGGGFVKQLGEMLIRADMQNAAKIKRTWPEYWEQYKKFAERDAKNET